MFDFPALDVALGLIFFYILLALACSTLNEAVSSMVGLRARYLQLGILNLLSGEPKVTKAGVESARAFYKHPLVQGLIRPGHGPDPSVDPENPGRWWRRPPYPSYLPSRTFVAALTDLAVDAEKALESADGKEAEAARARVAKADERIEKTLAALPNERLSEALLALYRSTGRDAAVFQHAAEQWYDDAMERVSGWYRRRIQLILAVIATILVVLLNADTLASARVLWRDDAVRAAVVQKAEASAEGRLTDVEVDSAIRQLDLPLGWNLSLGDSPTEIPNDVIAWLSKLLGLALSVAAVLLGAPFWFDLLGKVARLRSTGAPPPATDAVRSGDADQKRVGSTAPA